MYIRLISSRTYHLTWLRFAPASVPAGLLAAVTSAGMKPPSDPWADGSLGSVVIALATRAPVAGITLRQKALYAGGAPGRPFVLKRKCHWLVEFGRQIGGDIELHHTTRLFGRHQNRPVQNHRLDEMRGFGRHRPGIDMPDLLAGHRRHRKHGAVFRGVQHHVAMRVVDH